MDKIGNLATISNNLYDYNSHMDKIKNVVGNNANLDNSQDGIKPYKVSSEDVKLNLNLDEAQKEKIIKAFGYQKNSDGTYGYAQKFDIINGDLSLLSYQERVKLTGLNENRPLSGFTRYDADKVSIWGKITGLDPNFSKEEIKDLVDFIDESGGIAIEQIEALQYSPNSKNRILRTTPYTVEELASQNANSIISPWQIYELDGDLPYTISLLDSDLSIEDFKAQWAKHVIKIRYGLDINDEDAKNAVNIFKELKAGTYQNKEDKVNLNDVQKDKDDEKKFTPIQGFSSDNKTYKDEAIERLKKLYEMIKSEFDNGKTELEILKQLAKLNLKV
ncbi:hypothetical protein CHL_0560 [Campylobacter hyointestinalis subsp. lawsonii CCUG 27631]|uniref:hypothetical protein n=1 Tax=Campylobacter hyointestinalis TaxID=198 RepID=UPI0007C92405|nr:hypothetical protein [Campylobacter hyointestinalis]ANE33930.1 hypothetical protein CHL_0560 [Campylobacter hyointestinalis subsp. lawsonii CCUG 27631]